MMERGAESVRRKKGEQARMSLNGAVVCRARMVDHCLSVVWRGAGGQWTGWARDEERVTYFVDDTIPGVARVILEAR